mmetsp:Transcript_8301/g.14879  ORF Transcript_8301/g.14879 Transcript_8301/m.14879 type:complete len:101 (-) Transcript_8301:16-318(-)
MRLLRESQRPQVVLAIPPPVLQDGMFGIRQDVVNSTLPSLLREVGSSLSLPVADLHRPFLERQRAGLYQKDKVHLSEAGMELLASLLVDVVLALLDVDVD